MKKNQEITQSKLIEALEILSPIIPALLYWHDVNGIVLGANEQCLKSIGASKNIIGKTPYEFYPKETADHILKHHKKVMKTGKILSQEEMIQDITTGQTKYFTSIKAPLYNEFGKVIGIVGTSIEITAQKEAEKLKLEVQRLEILQEIHEKEKQMFQGLKKLVGDLQSDIKAYEINTLNQKLGKKKKLYYEDSDITFTNREYQIFYLTTLGKVPKEISAILTKLNGKNVSQATVSSILSKNLYPKFGVSSTSQMLEKASLLKLTPFMPENF